MFFFKSNAQKEDCNIVFIVGGSTLSNFKPIISLNQNLLPFFSEEINKYFPSLYFLKFYFLRFFQIYTYNKSLGIIFLTEFSSNYIFKYLKNIPKNYTIIPHGIDSDYVFSSRKQSDISEYSLINPYSLKNVE